MIRMRERMLTAHQLRLVEVTTILPTPGRSQRINLWAKPMRMIQDFHPWWFKPNCLTVELRENTNEDEKLGEMISESSPSWSKTLIILLTNVRVISATSSPKAVRKTWATISVTSSTSRPSFIIQMWRSHLESTLPSKLPFADTTSKCHARTQSTLKPCLFPYMMQSALVLTLTRNGICMQAGLRKWNTCSALTRWGMEILANISMQNQIQMTTSQSRATSALIYTNSLRKMDLSSTFSSFKGLVFKNDLWKQLKTTQKTRFHQTRQYFCTGSHENPWCHASYPYEGKKKPTAAKRNVMDDYVHRPRTCRSRGMEAFINRMWCGWK